MQMKRDRKFFSYSLMLLLLVFCVGCGKNKKQNDVQGASSGKTAEAIVLATTEEVGTVALQSASDDDKTELSSVISSWDNKEGESSGAASSDSSSADYVTGAAFDSSSAEYTVEAATEDLSSELLDEYGVYDSKDEVALYIVTYNKLPSNYITKKQAKKLGWSGGSLEKYAPGKCIGGDRYGNYEGILPDDKKYHECDIDTLGKKSRGAKRLVFSDDGYIYYTGDHYKSFELLIEP